jgi:hypothetical protein
MRKYFVKSPFSPAANKYLFSIPPSEYLAEDPSNDFRGRCRMYELARMLEFMKEKTK